MIEANHLTGQGKFSILAVKIIGIRARPWLDVESEKDKATVNFRTGRKTVYVPHRYPNPRGEMGFRMFVNSIPVE